MNTARGAASLLLGLVLAACGSTPGPTATPSPTAPSAPSAPPAVSPIVSPTPAPSPAATDPLVGKVVVTVSDNLVVRSEPRVSDDSTMYEPWLPTGTELTVLEGPVSASGYTWYKVAPVSFAGLSGPGFGWVAMAGKDGEAWIALAASPGPVELAQASVARATADPKDAKTAAASITAFGLDLYRALLADPKLELAGRNVVFSPTSIALALGMARAGARGATATEMDRVLHTSGWDALGAGLNALDAALVSRNATWTQEELSPPTRELALRIANAAFAQRGWTIEPGFLDAIAAAFGAGLRLVDFIADPESARTAINRWVSDQTAGRIPQLLQEPDVTDLTRLILVNAIYLKANWAIEFPKSATTPGPFTRLDGTQARVQTMSLFGGMSIPYASGTDWKATELLYNGAANTTPLAMTLILPDDLAAFEAALTPGKLQQITTALTTQRGRLGEVTFPPSEECEPGTYPYAVSLFLPRFGVETTAGLIPALESLGMGLAFDPGRSDFTGIHVPEAGDGRIYVSTVIHQANIDVDENGTEAAAATVVGMATTGGCGGPAPLKTITLRLNRPFLFVLRDVETGAVLFMGRVVDPSVKA